MTGFQEEAGEEGNSSDAGNTSYPQEVFLFLA
jgi:hypothetical protein